MIELRSARSFGTLRRLSRLCGSPRPQIRFPSPSFERETFAGRASVSAEKNAKVFD